MSVPCPDCGETLVTNDDGTACANCRDGGPDAFGPPGVDTTITGPAAQAETIWLQQLRMLRGLQRKLTKQIHAQNARGRDLEGYDPKLANEVVKLNRAAASALEHLRKDSNKATKAVSQMTVEQRVNLALGFLKRKQVTLAMLDAALAQLQDHRAVLAMYSTPSLQPIEPESVDTARAERAAQAEELPASPMRKAGAA